MNYILNQNGKVLKETLAGSNLDTVQPTLSGLRCFKMTFTILEVLQKPLPSLLSLCHKQ